ncbi:MAG: LysR family transcriptional regulator [Gemmobacter sp.]|nr:LysR family transcriptional regulator [Gemmobacter sp.]
MKAPLTDHLRTLSPARLRANLTVAEMGSFSAAGRRLGVSHTAVSQQIREMEAACGIRLFDRADGALRPTPVCQELAEIGQRIIAAEQDAARVLDRRDSQGKPRLRLGLGNSMPGIAIAARMLALHPGLSIAVETGSHQEILAAVLRRDVEVAVLPDLPPDPRFRRTPVITQEVVAIVATQGPWQGHDAVTLADLAAGPLVFRSRGSSTQKVVDRAFRRAGLAPDPRLTADTRDVVYEAVAAGIGAGFMWRHGTQRTDMVRRLPIIDLSAPSEEVAFALADERNQMVDLFLALAADHARAGSGG